MTHNDLIQTLLDTKGATVITFTANTNPKAYAKNQQTKSPNPYARPFQKINTVNGIVNFHYCKGVLRRLKKEGKSESDFRQGTSWHTPLILNGKLTPLCLSKNEQNQNTYVRFMFLRRIGNPTYLDKNHRPLDYNNIQDFLPEPSTYENQGLTRPLIFLTYNILNITNVTINKKSYTIQSNLAIAS